MILRRASACLLVLVLLSGTPGAQAAAAAPASSAPGTMPLVPTVIESGAAEMVSTEKETTFTFSNGVKVTGTNLLMTCDFLEVIALRMKEKEKDKDGRERDSGGVFDSPEDFKSLIATGNVRIVQNDREALCERAEVLPGDNKVILTGNPKVRSTDGSYQASGARMELLRGERTARILADGTTRPQFVLPPLKDLGYEKEKEKKSAPAPGAATSPAQPDAAPPITVPLTPAPR